MDTNFLKKVNNLKQNKSVFKPNLTTFLSFAVAKKKIKKNIKILDLGCGNGVIGILLFKEKKINKIYASDISKNAIKNALYNYKKNKIKYDLRQGSLFIPWSKGNNQNKFDYIISDVSAISSLVAKKSTWFKNNIPCDTGKDGTKFTIKVIKESKNFLNKKGKLQIAILSLSNRKKIFNYAKINFKKIKVEAVSNWFVPKEMLRFKNLLDKYKAKGYINYDYKFNNIICKTEILVCEHPI